MDFKTLWHTTYYAKKGTIIEPRLYVQCTCSITAANSKRANKQTNSVMAWYLLACACQTATKDLYQVYETFKNLCEFSSVWAENFWRFANANFEGLFYVFMGKKSTKWEFLHNCTKTLINIKVKKRWILVSKYSFSNLSCIFLSLMLLNLNIFFQFETNLQEQLKKTILLPKLVLTFQCLKKLF